MGKKIRHIVLITGILLLYVMAGCTEEDLHEPQWPEITSENKPWTRWWWHGSAVDKKNISRELQQFRDAGIGGVEITPIYGVAGYEDQFIDYLSPEWMEMLVHTLQKGDSLGIGVDMATGTGWPFGGPWIGAEEAAKYMTYKTYNLQEGEQLQEQITYVQEPFVRALGNRMVDVESGSVLAPGKEVGLADVQQPISANDDLQSLALEQVRFEESLPLVALMAYSDEGQTVDLTERVDPEGRLEWTAPAGEWALYALFEGIHGKMVERAGPGGEGLAIDHFDEKALRKYLQKFNEAFEEYDISGLRSFFNDSYEVDDARGEANWTARLLEEFEERRGYSLKEQLPALLGQVDREKGRRVLSDYRQTLSELLLDNFTRPWDQWAAEKGALIRNQAHGSPANILDLYAASDIPETEGTDIFRAKMASSAANVTGKKLVASESATWLNEHFTSSLSDVKAAVDRFFLSGVNHIFYHGTAYAPKKEPWPGWLFYAAVHFNPRNPFWKHFGALNAYIARTQSFLQSGRSDNGVLLYYPIHDRWSEAGPGYLEHFDGGIEEQFEGTSFKEAAKFMQRRGYGFDFISDQQVRMGETSYKTILLPRSQFVPLETLEKIRELAKKGATILFYEGLPKKAAGFANLEEKEKRFQALLDEFSFSEREDSGVRTASLGSGKLLMGKDLDRLLKTARLRREEMVDHDLEFLRRSDGESHTYFIANRGDEAIHEWVPIGVPAESAVLFDPMSRAKGFAKIRTSGQKGPEVYLQLEAGESVILRTGQQEYDHATYPYLGEKGRSVALNGRWKVEFTEGGPVVPGSVEIDSLVSWTDFGGEAGAEFSGSAVYRYALPAPEAEAEGWLLDLGEVKHSARVTLNGQELGTLIGPSYQLYINSDRLGRDNRLEIEVANLMGNRIAFLERTGSRWKKFYNINFSAWEAANRDEHGLFDASGWKPSDSGLLGPVTLTPVDLLD
ncbi:glycosyl hydrolase [Fodinibius sediminis]|uniref:Alpha-L-rhamnosidase n=1 Tax=Fodinibius sediminis TaxID=1214077 RepID=A0A521BQ92_9BACT|nr:glycosyl hydrolase [Fodinibius sediminis]SMO48921.1 alpha-L-rhamnosidase [Fodinibius sediminis]